MKILKVADLYGVPFQLSYFGDSKFKTWFSVALSLLTLVAIAFMIYFLGRDMFEQTNPKIMTQFGILETNASRSTLEKYISAENFTIAWRLEDSNYNYSSIDNLLYPVFRHSAVGDVNNLRIILPTKCSSFSDKLNPKFKLKIDNELDKWYCFDFEGTGLGPQHFWLNKTLLQFRVNYCPNDSLSDPSKCTSYETLYKELVNKIKILNMVVPMYIYDSANNNNPLDVGYYMIRRNLDLKLGKIQNLIFSRADINMDHDWLQQNFEDKKSYICMKSYMTDIWNFFDIEQYLKIKSLFSVDFSFDQTIDSFWMTYLKLDSVAASVTGFLNIGMFIVSIVCNFYNSFMMQFVFYEELFDFSEKYEHFDSNLEESKRQGETSNKTTEINLIKPEGGNATEEKKRAEVIELDLKGDVDSEANRDDTKETKIQRRDKRMKTGSKNPKLSEQEKSKKELIKVAEEKVNEDKKIMKRSITHLNQENLEDYLKKKRKIESFTIVDFLNAKLCCKSKLTANKLSNFERVRDFRAKICDFKSFANLILDFEKLKWTLLNSNQAQSFKLMDKVNLNAFEENFVKDVLEETNTSPKLQTQVEVLNYFIDRLNTKTSTDTDKKLLGFLSIHYNRLINKKTNSLDM